MHSRNTHRADHMRRRLIWAMTVLLIAVLAARPLGQALVLLGVTINLR